MAKEKQSTRALFVSSRICGTDGVSLEIEKWTRILEKLGVECFFAGGLLDRPQDKCFCIEMANFKHPVIQEINSVCFGRVDRTREMTSLIQNTAGTIKNGLYECFAKFEPTVVIAENALTLPMNIPLGVALDQVITETQTPCIAHHHDFAWERERYIVNAVSDFISAHFPPRGPGLIHVVINSQAREELSRRTGLSSWVIPNVMDFDQPHESTPERGQQFRRAIGVSENETLLLQPTRVVARKGIEHSIELARALANRKCKLVITHATDDEGRDYVKHIARFAEYMNVDLILAGDLVNAEPDQRDPQAFTIGDAYRAADLVTFPSTYEGFGNAFLEAIYYRKPIFCNRYTIFQTDIEPLGFDVLMMDGYLSESVIENVMALLDDPNRRERAAEHNFALARRHFSFDRVAKGINRLLNHHRD